MEYLIWLFIGAFLGMCLGIILMGLLSNRNNINEN